MAYIEHIACDKCGVDCGGWSNRSFGLSFAKRYARRNGWQVGKLGWFCPKCRRNKREERK